MKDTTLFTLLIALLFTSYSFGQNDCSDALVVCGNTGFNGLNATGVGIQELNNSNNCSGNENNSIWLKISINQGGTLGFTLTPELPNLFIDFDFFIFGPNVTCGNIGQAIRCSTTNPQAANSLNNTTGLNATETDISEGPGPDGNNFLQWLTVNDGDTYFLVIDRPIGSSNFSLTWNGTATFKDSPTFNIPSGTGINISECDVDANDDQKTLFNLEQNTSIIKGSQTNVQVTYHLNSNDALIGENAIPNSTSFTNTSNPQTIYTRITDINSGCFNTTEFELSVINPVTIPGSSYAICDDDSDGNSLNGINTFNLNDISHSIMGQESLSNLTIQYFPTQQDAINSTNLISNTFTNTIPNQQSIFIKVTNPTNCYKIKEISLIVNPLPIINTTTLTQCDSGFNPDGITLFNLNEANQALTNNDANLSVSYFYNGNQITSNYMNVSNPQVINALITNITTGCSSTSTITLKVNLVNPTVTIPSLCDEEASEDGFTSFDLNNTDLVLTPTQNVRFYETLEDALLEQNQIIDVSNYSNNTAYNAVIYFRIEEANSCNGIGTLNLVVNRLPNILKTQEKEYLVCENLPLKYISINAQLLEGAPNEYTYEWYKDNIALNLNTYSIQVNKPGIYTVVVTNIYGCSKTREIVVNNSNQAIIEDIVVEDLTSQKNMITVILNPSSLGNYVYTLDFEDGFYQTSPIFENVSPGFHTVFIKDLNGCGTAQKQIAIVGAPKYFTPNGDGFNDKWKIEGISQYFSASTVTLIYDRYGRLVHKVFALDDGWDGTLNGNDLPADDYWYVISLEDGRTVRGHFSLKR